MDLDDAFDLYIEVDGEENENIPSAQGSDSENKSKPAEPEENPRQPKTTNEQYNKIIAFVKEYNEQLVEKAHYDGLWNKLTDELNKIGPPSRSSEKWKRAWSEYKYRRQKSSIKRKRSNNVPLDANQILESSSGDLGSHSHRHIETIAVGDTATHDNVHFHSDILGKLDTLINQQSEVSEKLDLSNNLLHEISKKLYFREVEFM